MSSFDPMGLVNGLLTGAVEASKLREQMNNPLVSEVVEQLKVGTSERKLQVVVGKTDSMDYVENKLEALSTKFDKAAADAGRTEWTMAEKASYARWAKHADAVSGI